MRLITLLLTLVAFSANSSAADLRNNPNGRYEILLIFNHGSSGKYFNDCYWPLVSPRPLWLRKLDGLQIGNKKIRVETPCTDYVENEFPNDFGCGELGVCKRAKAIVERIKWARNRGFAPRNIFVGGYSEGAWATLLIKRWRPELFNGVISIAPAFNGTRAARLCKGKDCSAPRSKEHLRNFRSIMRQKHDKRLGLDSTTPPELRALVISFACDPFGRAAELPFATNKSVWMLTFPPELVGDIECARPDGRYRHYSEEPTLQTTVCLNPTDAALADRGNKLSCWSEEKGSSNYGRIYNCPPELDHICKLNQHTEVRRTAAFNDFVVSERVVVRFIAEHLESWVPRIAPIKHGSPCDFVKYPPVCRDE